jgi:excisionase family DNA binding protein
MSPWSADNTNSNNTNETTSTVKEEVPRMNTTTTPTPQRLEQALESFVEDLEGLEGAVQRFEEALLELEEGALKEGALKEGALKEGALKEGAPVHQNGHSSRLLSPSEVCQELEADKASVYWRLRSGEIPALKLGSALKVRREDLEGYMKSREQGRKHLRLVSEENGFRER